MKKLLAFLLICGLVFVTAGCPSGSTTKPRATTPATPPPTAPAGKDVIEYIVPTEVLVVKAGESKDVSISRKGKDLKAQDIAVTSLEPKVKVKDAKFKDKDEMATITITADADAPTDKEHTITLKVGDVTKTIKVKVEKKE